MGDWWFSAQLWLNSLMAINGPPLSCPNYKATQTSRQHFMSHPETTFLSVTKPAKK